MASDADSVADDDLAQAEIVAMDQADAERVAAWSYPGIYAFYDFAADPDDLAELLDAHRRAEEYFSVRLADHRLVGFVQTRPVADDGSIEIGLGLAPELAGRGLGLAFVRRLCDWVVSRVRVRPLVLVLRVAAFNARAITVYERAGFIVAGTEQVSTNRATVPFVRMTRTVD